MQTSRSTRTRAIEGNSNIACCFRVLAIIASGIIVALLVDVADLHVTLGTFLAVSGILRGTAAATGADDFWARDLNRWDEAAFLIFLSAVIHWAAG